jgi:uncharacterized membrane protein
MQQKHRQQRPLLAPAQHDSAALVKGLERAKNPEIHARQ